MRITTIPLTLVAVLGCVLAFSIRQICFAETITFIGMFLLVLAWGYSIESLIATPIQNFSNLSVPFLLGLMTLNVTCYATLYGSTMLGGSRLIVGLWGILVVVGPVLTARKVLRRATTPVASFELYSWCIAIFAALFWSQNAISPWREGDDGSKFFLPWLDSFYHAAWIDNFTRALVTGFLSDVRASGLPAYFYHAASYCFPALLCWISGVPGLDGFLAILVPLGFFCCGIAAYILGGFLHSPLVGLLSVILLLLIPAADLQGLSVPWLSFHWLVTVSPQLALGSAGMVLSWVIVIGGSRSRSVTLVLAGWVLSGLVLLTKAHIFVVNAAWLFIAPVFCFPGLSLRIRIAVGCVATAIVSSIVCRLQQIGLPIYQFDGSAFDWYSSFVRTQIFSPLLREFMFSLLQIDWRLGKQAAFGCFIFFASFGIFGALSLAYCLLRLFRCPVSGLSIIASLSYICSAVWGAKSSARFGNPEEFLHRPLVWSYLVCVVASAALISGLFSKLTLTGRWRWLTAGAVACLMGVPWYCGKTIERGPGFGLHGKRFTRGFIDATTYIRKTTDTLAVLVPLDGDPLFAAAALSSRALYAFRGPNQSFRPSDEISERSARVEELVRAASLASVEQMFEETRASICLTNPGVTLISSQQSSLHAASFVDGYSVYSR
jgi:hypothetical protein